MANDEEAVWMYEPNFPLAVIGCVAYGLLLIAITYLTWFRYRAWYFSVVVVGALVEVAAYVCRAYSVKHQTVIAPFVLTLTLTVIAPVFVAAGNYLLISRLILNVLPPSRHRILGIPGRRLTPIFVAFDVIAFLVQGNGSGVASSDNWTGETEKIGRYILVGGLAFQFVAFGLFLAVFGRFHALANRLEVSSAPIGWRKVVLAVYISSAMIMVRCIYRVCEFAEGMNGYAFRTEWLFWVFETLPMLVAIGVFCVYHPARYLNASIMKLQKKQKKQKKSKGGESTELSSIAPESRQDMV